MRSATRLILATGTATAACMLMVLPASAAKTDPETGTKPSEQADISVTKDGWIRYRSDLSSLGSKAERSTVKGTSRADGSCMSAGVDRGTAGDTKITLREEVAFNPSTCETEYLTAEFPAAEAAPYVVDSAKTTSQSGAANPTATQLAAAALTKHGHWVRTAWVDPISIDITSEKVALQWNSSTWLQRQTKRGSFQGCVSSVCLDSTYVVSKADYYGSYSNRFEFSGVTDFRNTSFANWVVAFLGPAGWASCGFPPNSTANFHHDEQVVGYKSGAWAVNWNDTKNGACTNLVHHDSSNGSGWPF